MVDKRTVIVLEDERFRGQAILAPSLNGGPPRLVSLRLWAAKQGSLRAKDLRRVSPLIRGGLKSSAAKKRRD